MAVLITAASHAEAYKLESLLRLPEVIFADHQELPHLAFSGRKFIKIPAGNSASYAHQILNIALNSGIEKIFPLYADEILPLAEARELFAEYGISVLVPSVLWLKAQMSTTSVPNSKLLVLEMGKVLAGELPPNILLPEKLFTGIFTLEPGNENPVFNLCTA